MKEDIYIQAIRYALAQNKIFPLSELFVALSMDKTQKDMLTREVFYDRILATYSTKTWHTFEQTPQNIMVWASAEDRFRLIDYEELQEARRAAAGANKHAILALAVSAALAIASIFLNIVQMRDNNRDTAALISNLEKVRSTMEMIEARSIFQTQGVHLPEAKSPTVPDTQSPSDL